MKRGVGGKSQGMFIQGKKVCCGDSTSTYGIYSPFQATNLFSVLHHSSTRKREKSGGGERLSIHSEWRKLPFKIPLQGKGSQGQKTIVDTLL